MNTIKKEVLCVVTFGRHTYTFYVGNWFKNDTWKDDDLRRFKIEEDEDGVLNFYYRRGKGSWLCDNDIDGEQTEEDVVLVREVLQAKAIRKMLK